MPNTAPALIVSCEHASNAVPSSHAALFKNAAAKLASHRGFDPGAAELAWHIANRYQAPLLCGEWSRLLVDLNRSADSEHVLSEWTGQLSPQQRWALLQRYHQPWRTRFADLLSELLEHQPRVVHLSVHSFTPVLDGQHRELEVGWLFDPQRSWESALAARLINDLQQLRPAWRIRANQPYLGSDDGHTTALRQLWPDERYAGLEVEINQALVYSSDWPKLLHELTGSLQGLLQKSD